jgi:hypothetical protein
MADFTKYAGWCRVTSYTLTWNELAAIVPLGLTLGEPNIKEDSQGHLIEISYPILSVSGAAMDALKSKKPKLTALLESMLNAAQAKPGEVQRRSLASGLNIDLIAGLDGMLRIQLYRDKSKYPSDVEWRTTVQTYFPIHLDERDPERFTANGRGYLRAAWELPK